jgi:hypothetical protein
MLIRNDWYIAAWAHEVPAGTVRARTICRANGCAFQQDLTIVAAR